MKKFEIHGRFKMGEKMQKFTKVFNGISEKGVREKVYCDIGSKHRVKRNNITILKVEEIKE
jgi:large subunit ribosomal protein LX